MPTVTALEAQQKNPERVSVFLDGAFAFGLPALDAARLHVGQQLSETEIAALALQDARAHAIEDAVALLARRPYSTAELRAHLRRKAFAETVIDAAIARLAELGYVDDRAFAEYWVANREQFRPRGPRALGFELRQKGIPQPIIEAVLAPLDVENAAMRAAQQRARRLRGITREQFRNKVGTHLVQRGFGYETARAVTDQLIDDLNEADPEYFAPDHTSEE